MNVMKNDSMKVKGIILAGGQGTRLYPLTKSFAKALLPVGNKPMFLYALEQLVTSGIKDIIIIIQPEYIDQCKKILNDEKNFGVNSIQYIPHPSESKGMAQAIGLAKPFINENEKIVSTCADVIIENSIKDAVGDFILQKEGVRVVAFKMQDTAGFGLLKSKGGKIISYLLKDKNRHQSGIVESGTYMFHYDVFDKIREMKIPEKGESNIRDLLNLYISKDNFYFNVIDGWWSDVGTSIEKYNEVNKRYEKR